MSFYDWDDFQNDPSYEVADPKSLQPLGERRFFDTQERPGFVYVLSNPDLRSIDGVPLLKIGRTKNHPTERAAKMGHGTGLPSKFKLEFAAWFNDHETAENYIHYRLDEFRQHSDREFFACKLELAIREISFAAMNIDFDCWEMEFDHWYVDVRETNVAEKVSSRANQDGVWSLCGYQTGQDIITHFDIRDLMSFYIEEEDLHPAMERMIAAVRSRIEASGKPFDPDDPFGYGPKTE